MLDNFELWEAHEAKIEAELEKYPICSYCGERIQDEKLWDINGELYHPDCAEEQFFKFTEDYVL